MQERGIGNVLTAGYYQAHTLSAPPQNIKTKNRGTLIMHNILLVQFFIQETSHTSIASGEVGLCTSWVGAIV